MSFFEQILSSINNPSLPANSGQLATILSAAQSLSNQQGIDPAATQAILSIVGNYTQTALQQQNQANPAQAQAVVNQFSGTSPNRQAVEALFSPELQTKVAQEISQRTGISQQQVQGVLPLVVPLVLNMLKMGENPSEHNNSVLNSFLDADGDGKVDLGDAMNLAGRFLSSKS